MKPQLQLSVQYAQPAEALPRWRLRRWVERTLVAAAQDQEKAPHAPPLRGAGITLRLVDESEGRALNERYRKARGATNVLTFEYGLDEHGIARGDIVLCLPVLAREASEQGKPQHDHAAHLVAHGVLHLLGYDHQHPDEAAHMEALETWLLARMGIADPYQPRKPELPASEIA